MADKEFKAIKVEKGPQGWGGPLTIKPSAEKDKIVAVTGGEIPKVAHRIAEMTGGTAVEGFRTPPPEEEIAAVVIDCGGTAELASTPESAFRPSTSSPWDRPDRSRSSSRKTSMSRACAREI